MSACCTSSRKELSHVVKMEREGEGERVGSGRGKCHARSGGSEKEEEREGVEEGEVHGRGWEYHRLVTLHVVCLQAVYRLCTMPLFLHLSKLLLLSSGVQSEGDPLLVKPAAIRCLFVQQRILDNRSSSLWAELEGLVKDLDTSMDGTGYVLSGRARKRF